MATDRVDVSKTEVAHIDDSQLDMAGHSKDGEAAEPIHVTLEPVKRLTLLECVRKYKLATLFCLLAAVGTLSDGYQVQMSGSIVALKGFIRTFGDLQDDGTYKVNPQHLALWGSLKNVAAMVGAFTGSYPADKIGRKWMMLLVQLIMVGAAILEQFATDWTHWLGARLLDGFSVGLAQCCINVYISEVAPTAGRGALLSTVNIGYAIGQFLSSISLNIVSHDVPGHWRHAVLSQFAICGAAILAWVFLPESPRWHCAKGREQTCKKIMSKINRHVEGYDVDYEYNQLVLEIENAKVTAELQGGGSYLDVFRGTNRRRLIVSFLPWHWQVAMGVPIVTTYSSYFYDMAGLSNPFNGTVTTNVVTIVMLIVAVPLIERLGRRTLLIWCGPISIVALLVMGGVLKTDGSAVGPVLVTFACVWTVGYNLSAGPMGYIYVAETSTLRLRAKTTGIAIFFIQGMAAVYVYIAPIMLNAPGLGMSNTVFFWAGTCTLVYIFICLMVPETKGRTYVELDELFERKIPAWRFAKTDVSQVDVEPAAGLTHRHVRHEGDDTV